MEEALLAGLAQIPWETLHHAYGSAEDVPEQLRRILATDEDVREEAYESLFSSIWHQGTVYEASAYAVPFLLRMLAEPRTPDRHSVLSLLACLADGHSYLAVHHREDDTPFNYRTLLAEQGNDFDTELQRELDFVQAANRAVAEGLDLFFTLAFEPQEDRALRTDALALIGQLPSQAATSIPRIQATLAHSQDSYWRNQMVHVLKALMDSSTESQHFFSDLFATDHADALRLTAACALLQRAQAQTPADVIDWLLGAVAQLGQYRQHWNIPEEEQAARAAREQHYGPLWWPSVLSEILDGFLTLPQAHDVLLQTMRLQQDPEDAEMAAMALLDHTFRHGQRTRAATSGRRNLQTGRYIIAYWRTEKDAPRQLDRLPDTTHAVLQALAAHDPLWGHESNLMELYGLPPQRDALMHASLG